MRCAQLLVIVLATACARAESSSRAVPVTDTLPGGIVRVRNPGPTGWSDSTGLRLVEDLAITGTEGEVSELANPDGLAVDRDGRIYVVDRTVKLFGADGSFIRTVGREGAGPGEYRGALIAARGTELLVQDPSLARLSVFDSAGHFRQSWRTACCIIAPPGVDASGQVTVWIAGQQEGHGSRFVRYGPEGAAGDTVELPLSEPAMWSLKTGYGGWHAAVPFTPVRAVVSAPDGSFLTGWPADYTITRTRTGRDTVRLFSRSWTPPPISAARREARTAYYRDFVMQHRQNLGGVEQAEIDRVFRSNDLPSTAPAYTELATDEAGTIWVKLDPGEDTLHSAFDLFSPEGVYLGAVRAPAVFGGFGRTVWTSTAVYSIQETPTGTPVIRRYRVVR